MQPRNDRRAVVFTALCVYYCLQRVYTVGGEETLSALRKIMRSVHMYARCPVPVATP